MIFAHQHDNTLLTIETGAQGRGHTLAQALFLAGCWEGVPLCAGLGRCGLCKVRYLSEPPAPKAEEEKRFSALELAEGWRLSCLHPPVPCEVKLPAPPRFPANTAARATSTEKTLDLAMDLAVDIGTTTVHWQALAGGRIIDSGAALNPQIGLGSEVMARLAFAATAGGGDILRERILEHLKGIAASLAGTVRRLAISGNPTMTALLLGQPTATLAAAPYALPDPCGREYDLGSDLPCAYIAPHFAPFVGADLSAGLAALHFGSNAPQAPFLLSDLGTNGEFVLQLKNRRIVASVPMGPALEGVGLSSGSAAAPGVITAFRLTPAGTQPVYGAGEPRTGNGPLGMTGTASLSLCALLLRNGLLEPSGQFISGQTPLARRLGKRLTTLRGEPAFAAVPEADIHLTASDVEEILKVKAAFNLALSALLEAAGLTAQALAGLHLAGAMGEHVSLDDLERLGFLPSALVRRTVRAGNTSLAGTALLLTRPEVRTWLEKLTAPKILDLASEPAFAGRYLERMVFTHVP